MLSILAETISETVIYDGKLSGAAIATLVFMIVSIGGGLIWSIYRAVTASKQDNQKQYPEEI